MKKLLLALLATAALGFGTLYLMDFRPLVLAFVDKEIHKIQASTKTSDKQFKVLFCGTGSPNRSVHRGQPCTAVVAAGKLFLFDAGEGALAKLKQYQAPTGTLEKIFVTHLHSDHISGIAEVLHNTWLYGRTSLIDVLGPPGAGTLVSGFELAFSEDLQERTRVMAAENLSSELAFGTGFDIEVPEGKDTVVYQQDGVVIRAFRVDHPDWLQAYGYRVDYLGKSLVISGDTTISDGIRKYAANVDVLVHEALNEELMRYIGSKMNQMRGPIPGSRMQLIIDAHTTTLDLANLAAEINARHLVLTHLIPAIPDVWPAEQYFIAGMQDRYPGTITVARDGDWLDLLAE